MNKYILMMIIISVSVLGALNDEVTYYWDMDESTGATAYDAVGNSNQICSGHQGDQGEWVTGIISYAHDFEGASDDYCDSDDSTPLVGRSSTDDFSISFWFKTSASGRGQFIASTTTSGQSGFALRLNSDFTIGGFVREGSSSSDLPSTSGTYNDGNWHFLVFTVENSGTELYLYIDDMETPVSSATGLTARDFVTGGRNIRLGAYYSYDTYMFDGILDEVALFLTYALTETDRIFLYDSGSPGTDQQYVFNEGAPPINFTVTLDYPNASTNYNSEIWNRSVLVSANKTLSDCDINISGYSKNRFNDSAFQFDIASLASGNYTVDVSCIDYFSQTRHVYFWFVYDTVDPIITINSPTTATYSNNIISIDIDFYDYYLYQTNVTITKSGNIYYTDYNIFTSGSNITYNLSDFVNLSNGIYTLVAEATDTHTVKEFNEYPEIIETSKNDIKKLNYKMKYGNINFYVDDDTELNTYKDTDRLRQEFYSLDKKEKTLIIEADHIEYLKNSPYSCHLILNHKYWWDCEGMPNYKIKVLDDQHIEIKYKHDKNTFMTDSLGGLNYNNESINFVVSVSSSTPSNTTITTIPSEITISFGNINIFFGLLLFIGLFILTIILRNYTVFIFTGISGLILLISILVYSDIILMYKIFITGLYSYFIISFNKVLVVG